MFPDRTVLSVKRRMDTQDRFSLGESDYSPQQISAFILKDLVERAERSLGHELTRAVVTLPAYFTEAQL